MHKIFTYRKIYESLRHETSILGFNGSKPKTKKSFEQFGLEIWGPQELQKNKRERLHHLSRAEIVTVPSNQGGVI